MTNGFLKKIKKGGNEAAKRVLVRIGEEIAEVPKHAGTQVVGSEAHPSPVVEALQGVKDVTPEEKKKAEAFARQRTQELSDEMARLRHERERRDSKRLEEAPEEILVKPGKPIAVPSSRPKMGMPLVASRKAKKTESQFGVG